MLNDLIKRLYDGEITPCEHRVIPGSQREKAAKEASRKADFLRRELSDGQKQLFDEILSDQMFLGALAEEDGFDMGFKLGGQFVLSILQDLL